MGFATNGTWRLAPERNPDSLLKGTALAQQQTLTLPPIEQWYLWLLENGEIPGALINWGPAKYPDKKSRPRHVFSDSLLGHAAKGQEVAPLRMQSIEVNGPSWLKMIEGQVNEEASE